MAKTFRKIHASSFGNFGSNTSKIPQWITANGGTYSKNISNEVTHLIATKESFEQNGPAVAEAKRLRTVKIVSYDWLADSLLSKGRTPRLVKKYLWADILKREKKKGQREVGLAEKDQLEGDQTERSVRKRGQTAEIKNPKLKSIKDKRKKRRPGKLFILSIIALLPLTPHFLANSTDPFDTKHRTAKAESIASNHRLYEAEGVTYSATLVRPSNTAGNTKETVQIKVYETIEAPHTYATHLRFSHRGSSKTGFLAPLYSSLDTAVVAFKNCFKAQTGKEWEDRLNEIAPSPKEDENGNTEPRHRGWFWFDSGPMSPLAGIFRDEKT
ncbi:hypothetical protein BJX76DRAFT_355253 [Aspergillus varians]